MEKGKLLSVLVNIISYKTTSKDLEIKTCEEMDLPTHEIRLK